MARTHFGTSTSSVNVRAAYGTEEIYAKATGDRHITQVWRIRYARQPDKPYRGFAKIWRWPHGKRGYGRMRPTALLTGR